MKTPAPTQQDETYARLRQWVTVGLFLFVVNALMFWAASAVLDGFQVRNFGAALIGSVIYSALGLLIESALGGLFLKK